MNSRERVIAALELRVPDKIPFHAYESPEHAVRLLGRRVHEIYLDSDLLPMAMIHSAKRYRNDIIYLRPSVFLSRDQEAVPDTGGGVRIRNRLTGKIVGRVEPDTKTFLPSEPAKPPICSSADIDASMPITPWKELVLLPTFQSYQPYLKEFGNKRFIFGMACAQSANTLDLMLGTEVAMIATMEDPAFCRAILDRRFEQLKEIILAFKSIGVDGIYTGDACASCSFFSPEIYQELFFAYQKKSIDFAHEHGLKTLLHICGKISPILEYMAKTGADVIESLDTPSSGGDIELADAKRRVGNCVCLKGNIDAVHVIQPGPTEFVYETCRQALQDAGPAGYILSTEQITRDTPIEHVDAMLQARDDFVTN